MNSRLPSWLLSVLIFAGVVGLGCVDWITGYELNFFVFYFLPVSVAAWFLGFSNAVAVAVLSALVWFGADLLSGHTYTSHAYAVWNTTIRLASFLCIGWSLSRIRQAHDHEVQTNESLRRALAEIKVLETFLPICAQCKKIRNKDGSWQQLESYFGQQMNTQFSHGYCPECARRVMEEANLITAKSRPSAAGEGNPAPEP